MNYTQLRQLAATLAMLSDDDLNSLVAVLSSDYTDSNTSTMHRMNICFTLPKDEILALYPLRLRRRVLKINQ